ncbi:MAG: AAA family ATPase [Pigmentiphaga sp.]
MRPHLWIIAGPNGSGKTTLTRRFISGKLPVVNPDDIAAALNPGHPEAPEIAIRAGREALSMQRRLLASRQSFALETTFSGNRELAVMREAKAAGYAVNLIFVSAGTAELSIFRIKTRTASGGHHVPDDDVRRRYPRSYANLEAGLVLADYAWILDNSGRHFSLSAFPSGVRRSGP